VYTPEQCGAAVANYANAREKLAHRLDGLAQMIDLDTSCRGLERVSKRRLARLVAWGHSPATNPQTGRFADPAQLVVEVARLREEGQIREANTLARMIREVRLLTVLAGRMSRSQQLDR
jgi:hypothetical protein